jgi:penicillin V acylase-like amidase (Ntn superfamily)
MCTNFSLFPTHANNAYTISARTMDFALNLKTKVSTFPRGQSFPQTQFFQKLSLPDNLWTWQSKYGYVAMNTGGQQIPATMGITDGMNEKGLSIGTLWLPDSQYPTWKPEATRVIPNFYFPAWILVSYHT